MTRYIQLMGEQFQLDETGGGQSLRWPVIIDNLGDIEAGLAAINSLVPSAYDSITLSYTGANLAGVVYKLALVVVSTLTLSYDGSNNLTGVVKT